jgi:protein-S-isoprenylcysteine O-methyltransferase Ste14
MVGRNIALTLIVGLAAVYVASQHAPAAWTSFRVAGLCLAVIGFSLWTTARFQLGSSFTVIPQAKQLVTRGLYSRIRNPIYVFGSLFVAGYILLLGRPIWLLIFAVVIPLQIWRAGKEAQVLEASFGEAYRRYRSKVWF